VSYADLNLLKTFEFWEKLLLIIYFCFFIFFIWPNTIMCLYYQYLKNYVLFSNKEWYLHVTLLYNTHFNSEKIQNQWWEVYDLFFNFNETIFFLGLFLFLIIYISIQIVTHYLKKYEKKKY
jgi:hypothetical protein